MRPERLELEGFTAFRDRTEVDFTDAELFAFTGPTGAGKSSLIDAVIFALYGTVPRLADRRRVAPVVSQGRVEARVRLDFVAGGRRFSAVRVVRLTATGAASTKEARLEETHPDGSREVLAGDADGLTEAVTGLLGLTYEHFTTAVVLPQGEFTRLLHAKPTERQALLKELLDLGIYDRLQQRAGTEQRNLGVRKEVLAHRLEGLADATPERRDALQRRIGVLTTLLAQLDEDAQQLRRLETDRREAEADAGRLDATATSLSAIHPPDGLEELDRDVADATAAVEAAGAELEVADAAVERSIAALAAVPSSEVTTALLDRYAELDRQRSQLERGQRALEAAREHATTAATAAGIAGAAQERAETALAAAQLAHRAAALAASLQPGDDCPVCGNRFDGLPHDAPAELAEATAARDAARHAAADATKAEQYAQHELVRVEEKLHGVMAQVAALEQALAGARTMAAARDDLAAATELAAAREQAQGDVQSGRRAVSAAQKLQAEATRRRQSAWTALDAARDAVAALGPPPLTRDNLAADWATLTGWAATRAADATAAAAKATEQAASHQRAADLVLRRMLAAAQKAGIIATDPADPAELPRATLRAQEADKAELARLEDDLEEASRLRAELAAATDDEQVASLLARLLRSDRFQAWVLDDAQQRLVTGATIVLHRLSNGAYSLVLDGKDFAVIDHLNAEARRSVRTLSGGETFLASLALALALADQVVELAGTAAAPLESLFLDEGFGTLDPDALDTVAAAIEELGSQGRVVGVVSHIRELAERLPVRFEVRKGPAGATVQRVLT